MFFHRIRCLDNDGRDCWTPRKKGKRLVANLGQDEALLQAKEGDKLAFAGLVKEHSGLVFSIALHFYGRSELAEDIAQDVFLELYRNIQKIMSPLHLVSWLRRSTTNRCIDQSRKAAFRTEVPIDGAAEHGLTPALPDGLLNETLRRQIASLPEWQRAVLILRYQEDMDPADIANTLNIPLNTVKSRLHRALESLREKMEHTQKARV